MAIITVNTAALKPKREFKRHEVKPGDNVYRILPPFGDLEQHNNYPYKRWRLVWLFDPATDRRRPFAMGFLPKGEKDPVSAFIDELTVLVAKLKESGNASHPGVKELSDLTWQLKPKTTYFYNAINKSGEVGVLELKKTAHDAMTTAMMEYIRDYSQDPTSLNSEEDDSGVWFKIKRDGTKGDPDTKYSVSKNQTKVKVDNRMMFVDDREALPENVANNFDKLGYDLFNMYKEVSMPELEEILNFNLQKLAANNATLAAFLAKRGKSSATQEELEEAPEPTPVPVPQGKKPVKIAIEQEPEDDEIPFAAPKAAPAKAPAPPKPAPTVTKQDEDDLADLINSIQ